MLNPVQITVRGIPRSGALERYVAEQLRRLDPAGASILACRVIAEALHRDEQQGTQLSVQLTITLPGSEVVVNREHGDNIYVAVRDAFEAAGFQIQDRMRRQATIEQRANEETSDPGT